MHHAAVTNPNNRQQILTIAGMACRIEQQGNADFLFVLSNRQVLPTCPGTDFSPLFTKQKYGKKNSRRKFTFYFRAVLESSDYAAKATQAIHILREGKFQLHGTEVAVFLIAEPIKFPGCPWNKEKNTENQKYGLFRRKEFEG